MRRVITYGTFDLLHYGHINLLRRAKEQGDYLIVALSTDEFNWNEKQKKSYFSYEDRKRMLEAIRYVDLVIPEESWDQKITDVDMILTGKNPENITILDEKFDEIYLNKVHELSLSPESVKKHHDMKIVYSPMHGAGVRLVPASLKKFGFTNVIMVKEQAVIAGDIPPVESPTPEERTTMAMAIDLAAKEGADLVLATDPDSDRIGVALRNKKGEYVLLNGNQTLVLLLSYQLTRWAERGELDGNQYVVKTIVTSQMANAVADYFKVKCYDCLTGFKFIAKIIRENEGKAKYIGGGEESFGYLAGDYVRDKDAVSAC